MENVSFWDALDKLNFQLKTNEEKGENKSHTKEEDDSRFDQSQTQALQTSAQKRKHVQKAMAEKRQHVLSLIEEVAESITNDLHEERSPVLQYSRRGTWDNIIFVPGLGLKMVEEPSQTTVKFDSILSVNKLALTLKVLAIMYKLIQSESYCTKRDIYYQDVNIFVNQTNVDEAVDNIACMLQVPRWNLHVLSTSKGCIVGNLTYREYDGNIINCSSAAAGVTIPNHVAGITEVQSAAKFILVVEKDATFQKLVDENICRKLNPCIIITGRGFPDINTRQMLKKLWDSLHIPVLALVDGDPHGIEIMSVYKFGSRSLSFEATNLTVPSIRWLGLFPSDMTRYLIPKEALIPLSKADREKADDLLKKPFMYTQPFWKKEVEELLKREKKIEMECLQSISANFLMDVYINNKIKYGGWL